MLSCLIISPYIESHRGVNATSALRTREPRNLRLTCARTVWRLTDPSVGERPVRDIDQIAPGARDIGRGSASRIRQWAYRCNEKITRESKRREEKLIASPIHDNTRHIKREILGVIEKAIA